MAELGEPKRRRIAPLIPAILLMNCLLVLFIDSLLITNGETFVELMVRPERMPGIPLNVSDPFELIDYATATPFATATTSVIDGVWR